MRLITSTVMLIAAFAVSAQSNLKIVWREVGQTHSNAAGASPTVQPLAAASAPIPATVKVDRLVVSPAIVSGTVGKPVCISQLDIAAYTESGQRMQGVPVSVDMQQDHLRKLTFTPKDKDLCFRPLQAGEYIIRLSSKVPAADGTVRGAQVFVRVT
ncbi:MAG: hypothetical protein ABW034_23630 [Steroidobacteraceae bacterium]